jgi:transcription elongation factor GreA
MPRPVVPGSRPPLRVFPTTLWEYPSQHYDAWVDDDGKITLQATVHVVNHEYMPVIRMYRKSLCGLYYERVLQSYFEPFLKDELQRLKHVERPSVINAISEARAQGDLSENAEYDAAKEKQAFIEGRIKEVESKLSAAQIIDPSLIDADGKVVFGSTVELEDLETGQRMRYQIVGDDEASLENNKISISSPIARALIRKEAGETVAVITPGGQREVEIIKVQYI